jgi:hypothetical protein
MEEFVHWRRKVTPRSAAASGAPAPPAKVPDKFTGMSYAKSTFKATISVTEKFKNASPEIHRV